MALVGLLREAPPVSFAGRDNLLLIHRYEALP